MAMNRVSSSLRGAERSKKSQFPQLPPAPQDYPTFPD
ncbi:MAG: Isoprenyl transferase, partial [Mycobacterium sp.]|nr:Isoprenyl transferase [Mycobacterium sp.]